MDDKREAVILKMQAAMDSQRVANDSRTQWGIAVAKLLLIAAITLFVYKSCTTPAHAVDIHGEFTIIADWIEAVHNPDDMMFPNSTGTGSMMYWMQPHERITSPGFDSEKLLRLNELPFNEQMGMLRAMMPHAAGYPTTPAAAGRYVTSQLKYGGDWGDMNADNLVDCIDFALLFYLCYDGECVIVRNVNRSTGMNHLFNAVKINDKWVTVEPQDPQGRTMEWYWGKKYDPQYDVDETIQWLKALKW
jgi:hypothetical protein